MSLRELHSAHKNAAAAPHLLIVSAQQPTAVLTTRPYIPVEPVPSSTRYYPSQSSLIQSSPYACSVSCSLIAFTTRTIPIKQQSNSSSQALNAIFILHRTVPYWIKAIDTSTSYMTGQARTNPPLAHKPRPRCIHICPSKNGCQGWIDR
jgi:hypothetical protein